MIFDSFCIFIARSPILFNVSVVSQSNQLISLVLGSLMLASALIPPAQDSLLWNGAQLHALCISIYVLYSLVRLPGMSKLKAASQRAEATVPVGVMDAFFNDLRIDGFTATQNRAACTPAQIALIDKNQPPDYHPI